MQSRSHHFMMPECMFSRIKLSKKETRKSMQLDFGYMYCNDLTFWGRKVLTNSVQTALLGSTLFAIQNL